jgi:hypothetical protein
VLYSVSLDVDTALAPPRTCLACGAPQLRAVTDQGEVSFVCRGCLRSWGYELGRLVPLPRAVVPHPRERGAT